MLPRNSVRLWSAEESHSDSRKLWLLLQRRWRRFGKEAGRSPAEEIDERIFGSDAEPSTTDFGAQPIGQSVTVGFQERRAGFERAPSKTAANPL